MAILDLIMMRRYVSSGGCRLSWREIRQLDLITNTRLIAGIYMVEKREMLM